MPEAIPSTEAYLMLSGTLFAIGLIGVIIRRNMITVLMAIELMMNAVNINLVAFSHRLASLEGQVFTIFVITATHATSSMGDVANERSRNNAGMMTTTSAFWHLQ